MEGRWLRVAAASFLILAAVAQLGYRLAPRAHRTIPLWDFASVYSSTRTWLGGGNPYDNAAIRRTWTALTGDEHVGNQDIWTSVYPPTTFLLLAPIAALPPTAALTVWEILLVVLVTAQFAALLDLSGIARSTRGLRDPRVLILLAGSIAAAPLQMGLLGGQPTIAAAAMIILAVWCAVRAPQRANPRTLELIGGVLLGVATALKPHVVAPFVLYFLVLRRWRLTGATLITLALLSIAAIGAMHISHIDWAAGWSANLRETTQAGGVNDYTPGAPYRDEIVDVQLLLRTLVSHSFAARAAAGTLVALLVGWYVRSSMKRSTSTESTEREGALLPLAALAALSLLPVYHRVYDASLLTLAFAWALSKLDAAERGQRIRARIVLAILCVFLVPFDVLNSIVIRSDAVRAVMNEWWFQLLVVPHYAWAALLLTIALLWAWNPRTMARRPALAPAAHRSAVSSSA